jgi:hypothetical protein
MDDNFIIADRWGECNASRRNLLGRNSAPSLLGFVREALRFLPSTAFVQAVREPESSCS